MKFETRNSKLETNSNSKIRQELSFHFRLSLTPCFSWVFGLLSAFVTVLTVFSGASFWLPLNAIAGLSSNSPLANAAEKSDRASIRTLLKQHVEINASQVDGMTALHWAARLDDLE